MAENTTLPALHVGGGYRHGALTWFPVWTDAPVEARGYDTASDALEVAELEQESVPELRVRNRGDRPVVVFEGSVFEGGFQTRTLTRTSFVPAAAETTLPVLCVEASRWGGTSREHRIGNRIAPSRVRSAARGVTRAPQRSPHNSRQGQVWDEVSGYAERHQAASATRSLAEIDQQVQQRRAQQPLPAVTALPGQRGVIIAALGQPIVMELFDHPDTLAERLGALLESVRLDVHAVDYVETPSRRARRFANRISQAGLRLTDRDARTSVFQAPANNFVATDAVGLDDELLHLSCLNPRHELVLAA